MGASRDLWVLPLGQEPKPSLVTEFHERGAVFSPDGEWLAFVTNESGLYEVFELPAAAYNFDNNFADYDVAPDGRFFAIRGEDQDRMEINVVLNWSEELRRLLAPN